MPTINFSELKCIRQHDVTGVDEPKLTADGLTVWSGTLKKGRSKTLGDDYNETFTGSIDLKLFENNSKGDDPKPTAARSPSMTTRSTTVRPSSRPRAPRNR